MSDIPVEEPPGTIDSEAKPRGFWQRLARALDEHFVARTKRVVPEVTLRRSRYDVNRCRRLMHKSSPAPAEASISRVSQRRVAQTRP